MEFVKTFLILYYTFLRLAEEIHSKNKSDSLRSRGAKLVET